METTIYPSSLLTRSHTDGDLEKRLEKKVNDVIGIGKLNKNIQEIISPFEDENYNPKRNYN